MEIGGSIVYLKISPLDVACLKVNCSIIFSTQVATPLRATVTVGNVHKIKFQKLCATFRSIHVSEKTFVSSPYSITEDYKKILSKFSKWCEQAGTDEKNAYNIKVNENMTIKEVTKEILKCFKSAAAQVLKPVEDLCVMSTYNYIIRNDLRYQRKFLHFFSYVRNQFSPNLKGVAQKLALPCPFEVLDVFGRKSKSEAPRALKFDTKLVSIKINIWWKFGVDTFNLLPLSTVST